MTPHLSMQPTPETVTETHTTMKTVVRLLQQFQLLIAMAIPVGVAMWAGFSLPSRLTALEDKVAAMQRGQNVLVALVCARGDPTERVAAVQLECDRITLSVTQAGHPRTPP